MLKFAGFDGIFFTGKSDKPVYLFINDGKPELKSAAKLWGKDCFQTEDMLKEAHGQDTESISIGVPGENLSLISCIITARGAAAGRSGLGAVMGSKKLKAIAAKGTGKVQVADQAKIDSLRKEHLAELRSPGPGGGSFWDGWHTYGTSAITKNAAHSGDSPVKNWGGVGIVDFPDVDELSGDNAIKNLERRGGCWHCMVGCEGVLKAGTGEYKYPAGTRRVEYETHASFGSLCLNNNIESINMANHLCNCHGIDTISAGTAVAFAIECYENGILTKADTGGLDLKWGNHKAIVAITEQMCRHEGLGAILADGVKSGGGENRARFREICSAYRRSGTRNARSEAGKPSGRIFGGEIPYRRYTRKTHTGGRAVRPARTHHQRCGNLHVRLFRSERPVEVRGGIYRCGHRLGCGPA
jgi:aldehyde:ferredoxin oxidoreductase